jgi:lysophospholipase L1-like esterase
MPRTALCLLLICIIGAPTRAQSTAPATSQAATAPSAPASILKPNDLIAVCGDSITEQKLYSVYIEDYLLMCKPTASVRAMQFGWGGEKVDGFLHRMSNVLRFPVTVATTFYGMNDGGYGPLTPENANAYRNGTKSIVETFKKSGVRFIVVGSPGVVDSKTFRASNPDEDKVYNKTLAELRDIARDVAKAEGVAFADVHATMMDVMAKAKAKYGEDYPFAGGDGVHPGPNGHIVTAYAFLKALGCDGDIGTISVDLTANKADATEGHKVLSTKDGSVEIESTRYPFCFFGDPKLPEATIGVIEFFPFNKDLNRLTLKVAPKLGAAKMKVTWGTESKEFPVAELEKGINLADEFAAKNPFSEPFKKVEESIRAQQNYETPLIKELLHNWPNYVKLLPEQKENFDKIAQGAVDKAKTLNDAAVAAMQPVKHTIKIEVTATATPPASAPTSAPATTAPAK